MDPKAIEIIQETGQLFLRYGIKSMSMEELARQMGISKKTLYQHFTDKSDLVEKTVMHLNSIRGCNFKSLNIEGMNAIDQMFKAYSLVNDIIRKHNPGFEFDLERFYPAIYRKSVELHRHAMFESTLANLKQGKAEGYYRQNFDEQVIAKLYVIRIEYLAHTDIVTTDEIHSNSFLLEIFKYHLYGVISNKGHQYIEKHYPEFISNE